MVEMTFFKWLGLTTLALFLFLGGCYWVIMILNKFLPNRKFWFKYKVLRRKFNERDVKKLSEYLNEGRSEGEVAELILLSPQNKRSRKQVKEVLYIYSEMQKIERGIKK